MKHFNFKVIGTSPFLYHKFSVETFSNKRKPKSGSAGNDSEEWRETVWVEGKNLYIPGYYFFSAIFGGGSYVKSGRGTIAKKIAGCLIIESEKCFVNRTLPDEIQNLVTDELPRDTSQPVYLDIRGVKNPTTKGRNIRYRLAMSKGWETQVEGYWDETVLSMENVKQAIESAGKFLGVGDARLIGNGRFDIEFFKK